MTNYPERAIAIQRLDAYLVGQRGYKRGRVMQRLCRPYLHICKDTYHRILRQTIASYNAELAEELYQRALVDAARVLRRCDLK